MSSQKIEEKMISRRQFVKGAASGVVGVAGAGALSGCLPAPLAAPAVSAPAVAAECPPCPTAEVAKRSVVICGGGGGGLAAAVQAMDSGAAEVTLLEVQPQVGGSTAMATGLIYGAEHYVQKKLGIEDTKQEAVKHVLEQGEFTADPIWPATLIDCSPTAIAWLRDLGATIKEDAIAVPPRTVLVLPAARGMVETLLKAAEERGVKIVTETRAMELLTDGGKVVGVKAVKKGGEEVEYRADAVVLATGEGATQEFLEKYCDPVYKGVAVEWGGGGGSQGDGMMMAEKIGAQLVDVSIISTNIASVVDKDMKVVTGVTSSLRHAGGSILLNQALERFTNEDLFYTQLAYEAAKELAKRGEQWAWQVWDQASVDLVPISKNYPTTGAGAIAVADTIAALAEGMGVDAAALEAAITKYNSYFEQGLEADPEFGRPLKNMHALTTPPFYAWRLGVSVGSTAGGIKCDTQCRTLDKDGKAIPELFVAGVDIGGRQGKGYVTGMNLLTCLVTGRIAGRNAATGAYPPGGVDLL